MPRHTGEDHPPAEQNHPTAGNKVRFCCIGLVSSAGTGGGRRGYWWGGGGGGGGRGGE